ncbi:acid phosphatase det1 [Polyrhizophydium stewartii]|uniref:Acid phosphatase det1 n=1 Tax=Polyrhizophydium stewartii TaxID=2732419 RepID=A0ABR4N4E1_9FUNG
MTPPPLALHARRSRSGLSLSSSSSAASEFALPPAANTGLPALKHPPPPTPALGPPPTSAAQPDLQHDPLQFDDFFSLKYERLLTSGSEMLCKDFCLFTLNKRHMILASAVPSGSSGREGRRFPHSLSCIKSLDNITFWVIDIETGDVCDKKVFKNDYIYLTHHAGVHLYEDLLGITSVQNQCIHVLHIKDSGQLVHVSTIGYYVHEDDALVLSAQREAEERFQQQMRALEEEYGDWTMPQLGLPGASALGATAPGDPDDLDAAAAHEAIRLARLRILLGASANRGQRSLFGLPLPLAHHLGGAGDDSPNAPRGGPSYSTLQQRHMSPLPRTQRHGVMHPVALATGHPLIPADRLAESATHQVPHRTLSRPIRRAISRALQAQSSALPNPSLAGGALHLNLHLGNAAGVSLHPSDAAPFATTGAAIFPPGLGFTHHAAGGAINAGQPDHNGPPHQSSTLLAFLMQPTSEGGLGWPDQSAPATALDTASSIPDERQAPMSGIKHRVLAYLYRRAVTSTNPGAMSRFHLVYPHISSLVMWRMQFLDRRHILIKLGSIDNVTGTTPEPSTGYTSFFAIYSLDTTQVLGVFENNSQELFEMFEKWDCFRGTAYNNPIQLATRPSNNEYARELVRRHMYTVRKARNGGFSQAIKRVLSSLPINAQSFSDSAYFDNSLFSYDDKALNSCDRLRPGLEFPCKFYSRHNARYKFKLETNTKPGGHPRNQKSFVLYVFHPTDPFVLTSLQHQGTVQSMNVHYAET